MAYDVAWDGVGELLEVFVPLTARRSVATPPHIHPSATDCTGTWQIAFGDRTVQVDAMGDLADDGGGTSVRGRAVDAYLWLWGRGPLRRLPLSGDPVATDQLRRLTSL